MKTKIFIPLAFIFLATSCGCGKIISEHEEAMNVEIRDIDFKTLKQGEYSGYYAGGMNGWRENECLINVDSVSRLISIELISSEEDREQSFFDELYGRILEAQSLQVDFISGATLTSKAHLKAVENALEKAVQETE